MHLACHQPKYGPKSPQPAIDRGPDPLLELERFERLAVQLKDVDAVAVHHGRLNLERADQLEWIEEVIRRLILRHDDADNAVNVWRLAIAT